MRRGNSVWKVPEPSHASKHQNCSNKRNRVAAKGIRSSGKRDPNKILVRAYVTWSPVSPPKPNFACLPDSFATRSVWFSKAGVRFLQKFGICTNYSVSQKVQMFGERSMLMKCRTLLFGCLSSGVQFFIFKIFHMVFWADFMKVFCVVIWVKVGFIYVQLGMKLLEFIFLGFSFFIWAHFKWKVRHVNLRLYETVQNRYLEKICFIFGNFHSSGSVKTEQDGGFWEIHFQNAQSSLTSSHHRDVQLLDVMFCKTLYICTRTNFFCPSRAVLRCPDTYWVMARRCQRVSVCPSLIKPQARSETVLKWKAPHVVQRHSALNPRCGLKTRKEFWQGGAILLWWLFSPFFGCVFCCWCPKERVENCAVIREENCQTVFSSGLRYPRTRVSFSFDMTGLHLGEPRTSDPPQEKCAGLVPLMPPHLLSRWSSSRVVVWVAPGDQGCVRPWWECDTRLELWKPGWDCDSCIGKRVSQSVSFRCQTFSARTFLLEVSLDFAQIAFPVD